MWKHSILIVLLVGIISPALGVPLLWPLPHNVSLNSTASPDQISPCSVRYVINSPLAPYIENIVNFYLTKVFKCVENSTSSEVLNIVVPAKEINLPL